VTIDLRGRSFLKEVDFSREEFTHLIITLTDIRRARDESESSSGRVRTFGPIAAPLPDAG
jgi:hypothetical protein